MKHIQKIVNRVKSRNTKVMPPENKVKLKTKVIRKSNKQPEYPLINIITRTSGRPNGFQRCQQSISNQTYTNIRHIVSYDNLEDKEYVDKYNVDAFFIDKAKVQAMQDIPDPKTGGRFIYNLYFNILFNKVKNGWIMILDDDDYLSNPNAVQTMVNNIQGNTDMLVWQMKYPTGSKLPTIQEMGSRPRLGRIGSPCIMVHSGIAKTIRWDGWKCGDFRFISKVWSKTGQKRWIKDSLVLLGSGGGFGLRKDIPVKNIPNPVKQNDEENVENNSIIEQFKRQHKDKKQVAKKPNDKLQKRIKEIRAQQKVNKQKGVTLYRTYHEGSRENLYSIQHTFKVLSEKMERGENFTYLRFGDNDFMHILGENKGKALGHNKTIFSPKLQKKLTKALGINDENYIRTYNFGSYSEANRIFRKQKPTSFNYRNYNLIRQFDKSKTFYPVLFFYTIAGYYKNYVKGIFKHIKQSDKVLYVGGVEKKYAEGVLGKIKTHIKTAKTNSTSNIDHYTKQVKSVLESGEYKYVILAAGQLSRVLGGQIFSDYGNKYTVLDIGGVIESFYPHSTKRSVVDNKGIYRKNFNFSLEDVYISMTILPSRILKTRKCIESLIKQSYLPDKIFVWLPKNCKRDKTKVEKIPAWFNHELIDVRHVEDKGSITKIYYSLLKEKGKDCSIISVDDDVQYPMNFIKNLHANSKMYKNGVICYRGRSFKKGTLDYNTSHLIRGTEISRPKKVDIVTGTWGALYKPHFFDEEFFNLNHKGSMYFTDDIWISGHLARKKVPIYVVPINQPIQPLPQHAINPLWDLNKSGKNNNDSIQEFKKYFRK